jgi:hypothetical protein
MTPQRRQGQRGRGGARFSASARDTKERRLLYVAMTRAKDDLHLIVPQRFFTHGQTAQGDRHARHRIVVFGRREEQPVRGDDRLLQCRYSLGYPVRRFNISVVQRNAMDCLDREFRVVGHELRRRTKQRGIE